MALSSLALVGCTAAARSQEQTVTSLPSHPDADIVCGDGTTDVQHPSVESSVDGVHLQVWSSFPSTLVMLLPPNARFDDASFALGEGASEVVVSTPPGAIYLRCSDARPTALGLEALESLWRLDIEDARGVWSSGRLDCADRIRSRADRPWPIAATPSPPPSFTKAIRSRVSGVLPGDLFKPVGYPADALDEVMLIRGGRRVASFERSAGSDVASPYADIRIESCSDVPLGTRATSIDLSSP